MKRTATNKSQAALALLAMLAFPGLWTACGGEILDLSGMGSETVSDFSSDSTSDTDVASGPETDTAAAALVTTLLRTVEPLVDAVPQKDAIRGSWGLTEEGPGEPFTVRDELGADPGKSSGEPTSLAFFWHLTDSQIIDEGSPARLIQGDAAFGAAFRLQESWSTQLLDAAVRTGRAFHEVAPFDCALLTGDLVDNIQSNELDWVMTLLDGGTLNPDSGHDDNPRPGAANDPHDPFEAKGLGDIPWYFTLGNHDDLVLGNFSSLDWLVADPTGNTVSQLSNAVVPTCLSKPFFKGEASLPERCFVPDLGYYQAKELVPDDARAFIERKDWVDALWSSTTSPLGHGLESQDPVFDYAVDMPGPGGPVRLVVLDTVAPEMLDGALTMTQLAWLEAELRSAEENEQLLVVASHHPSWSIKGKPKTLVSLLQSSPNVVLHISGHEHKNIVVAHPAPEGLPASHGYFEVVTSSTMVWPQQTRLVELVDNRDGTVSVFCTMLDFEIPQDMPEVEAGRFYGLFDLQAGSEDPGQGTLADRNVELRDTIPESVASALAALPQRVVQTRRFPVDE